MNMFVTCVLAVLLVAHQLLLAAKNGDGLNKAGNRRGMSPGSQKAARANARRVGAKKGETRALQHGAYASDETIARLTPAERRGEIAQRWAAVRERMGTDQNPEFDANYDAASRIEMRLEHLYGQDDPRLGPEILAFEQQLLRLLDRLLLTPRSQIESGYLARREKAEREQKQLQPLATQAQKVAMMRQLIELGVITFAELFPEGAPATEMLKTYVLAQIARGRIEVPNTVGEL